MSAGWSVRPLAEDDWPLLRAVRLAMLLDHPGAYGSTFVREAAFTEETWRARTGPGVFHALRPDGLPLGSVTLLWQHPGQDPVVVAMWVAAHARGTGVADDLVNACLELAAERGESRVRLDVMGDNPRAVAFFLRAGFAFEGEDPTPEGCRAMSRSLSR